MDGMTIGWRRAGVVALGLAWVPIALAETMLGPLDALDDVEAIAANSGLIAAAGLLHILGGALLVFALAAIAGLALRTVLGRIGWVLAAALVPCIGAFGMLHLLAAEMGAPGLDGGAMEQFLVERLGETPGFWAIPVTYSAFVGALSVALLAAGLARLRIASWWAVGVIGAGMVAHAIGAESELVEILSQWVIAAGVLWTAVGVWRAMGATLPRNGRSDPARREAAALE